MIMKTEPTAPLPIEEDKAPFAVRPYRKTELARLYFPELRPRCALKKLNRWIERNKKLSEELYAGPEGRNESTFSRRQVKLIVGCFDEP